MSVLVRRGVEALAGTAAVGLAVAWLSGACGERVAPGRVAVASGIEASAEDRTAVVVERRTPAVEWASGQIASARHTSVSTRVLARIEEVRVSAGSLVAEGDVLVVLDARDLEARVTEAEEALRSARARLALARREHERARQLLREGAGTRQRLDQTASELEAAQAAVAGAEAALREARTALSFTELRSPVTGRVVDRLAEPGDTAVPGRPLLRIYDPSLLRVEVPVRESLAVKLRVGQSLRVEVPAFGDELEGEIDEVVPFAEPGARTLLVKVRLAARDERLFAGMFARVAIPAGVERRLWIPRAAVETVGQLEFVTVVEEDGRLARRLVTTGVPADGEVEVLSGLRAGERVRLRGSSLPSSARRAPSPQGDPGALR